MTISKCVALYPVGKDDLDAVMKMARESSSEAAGVKAYMAGLEGELEGLRGQLKAKGFKVDVVAGEARPLKRLRGADTSVEDAAQAIIAKEMRLSDAEYMDLAEDTYNKWTGAADTRMSPDDPLHSAIFGGQEMRGALMERTLPTPDNKLLKYMNTNPVQTAMQYIRTMASDIMMHERFGGVDAPMIKTRLNTEKNAKLREAKTPEERLAITKEFDGNLRDLEAMRDRLRGTYGHSGNAVLNNIGRFAQTLSAAETTMSAGGFGPASIPDLAGPVIRRGFNGPFRASYGAAVKQLMGVDNVFKDSTALYRAQIGTATETVLRSRASALNDLSGVYEAGTVASRIAQQTAEGTVLLSGQTLTTDFNQAVVATSVGGDILRMSKLLTQGELGRKDIARLAASNIDASHAQRLVDMFESEGGGYIHEGVYMPNVANWTDKDMAKRFMHAVSAEVDKSVVHPGLDTPLFMSIPVIGLIGKYKRIISGMNTRLIIPAMQMRDANAMSGILTMTMLGMLTYAIRAPLSGQTLSDRPQDWLKEGIDRAGLGVWLQEFNAMAANTSGNSIDLWGIIGANRPYSRFSSRSKLGSVLGPMVGKAEQLMKVGGALGSGEFGASDLHNLRQLLPFQNLFYIRKMIDNIEASTASTLGMEPRKK
jgi:hypothetical protein